MINQLLTTQYDYMPHTEVTAINHIRRITVHIHDISLNKYGCHTAIIVQTANILHGHIDPTLLHVYAKIQPTATITSR